MLTYANGSSIIGIDDKGHDLRGTGFPVGGIEKMEKQKRNYTIKIEDDRYVYYKTVENATDTELNLILRRYRRTYPNSKVSVMTNEKQQVIRMEYDEMRKDYRVYDLSHPEQTIAYINDPSELDRSKFDKDAKFEVLEGDMTKYRYHTTTDAIYAMCNEHSLFTGGDIKQYERMFDRARQLDKNTIHDVAVIIWICSDETNTLEYITDLLLEYWQKAEIVK